MPGHWWISLQHAPASKTSFRCRSSGRLAHNLTPSDVSSFNVLTVAGPVIFGMVSLKPALNTTGSLLSRTPAWGISELLGLIDMTRRPNMLNSLLDRASLNDQEPASIAPRFAPNSSWSRGYSQGILQQSRPSLLVIQDSHSKTASYDIGQDDPHKPGNQSCWTRIRSLRLVSRSD